MKTNHDLKGKHKNGSVGNCAVNLPAEQLTSLPYPSLFIQLLNAYQSRLNLIAGKNSDCLSAQSFKR